LEPGPAQLLDLGVVDVEDAVRIVHFEPEVRQSGNSRIVEAFVREALAVDEEAVRGCIGVEQQLDRDDSTPSGIKLGYQKSILGIIRYTTF